MHNHPAKKEQAVDLRIIPLFLSLCLIALVWPIMAVSLPETRKDIEIKLRKQERAVRLGGGINTKEDWGND